MLLGVLGSRFWLRQIGEGRIGMTGMVELGVEGKG